MSHHLRPVKEPAPGSSGTAVGTPPARFLTVAATARLLCMSEATLYRAIRSLEFPAVRIRNRYVVPERVLDALEDAAVRSMRLVDAAEFVDGGGEL